VKKIGVAICALSTGESGFQIFPAGPFRSLDGRPKDAPHWVVANPGALLAKAASRKNDFLIDYEHQILNAGKNGQPAPAAGWFAGSGLEWVEGRGLFARNPKWTEAASKMISGDEYRYISPVFLYDGDGNVLELLHVALTNDPALDGMQGVSAAASMFFNSNQEVAMKGVLKSLGLPEDASEQDALAAIDALKKSASDAVGNVAALRSELASASDPARFVPIAAFDKISQENAALRKQAVYGVMKAAASKLPSPELREWAEQFGEKHGAVELEKRLAAMAAMPALDGGTQSGGSAPGTQEASVDSTEMAVLKMLGLDDEAGRKAFAGVKGAK
jgi:phage I-like protein